MLLNFFGPAGVCLPPSAPHEVNRYFPRTMICVYCSTDAATTHDHLPPKQLLRKPKPGVRVAIVPFSSPPSSQKFTFADSAARNPMTTQPLPQQIELRDRMWRRDDDLPLKSALDAERFIEDLGLCKHAD